MRHRSLASGFFLIALLGFFGSMQGCNRQEKPIDPEALEIEQKNLKTNLQKEWENR